jgi:hypothetical protein
MQNNLGVARGMKSMPTRDQFSTQFRVVVNFPVEDENKVFIIRNYRLGARSRIYDPQPGGTKRDYSTLPC